MNLRIELMNIESTNENSTPRWICTDCGLLESQEHPHRCPVCGEEVLDMETDADESFLYELFKQNRARRWMWGTVLGLVLSPLVILGLIYVFGEWAALTVNELFIVLFSMAFAWVFSWTWKRFFYPEPLRRAEDYIFRRHRSDTWRLVVTSPAVLTVVLTIIGFATVLYVDDQVIAQYVLDPEALRRGEHLSGLVTSLFLHADLYHLISNLVGLLLFGVVIDLRLGHLRTAIIMLGAGIAGGLAHGFLTADPHLGVLGASGIVYGLLGANLVLVPMRKIPFYPMGVPVIVPTFVMVFIFVGVYTVFHILMADNIAWLAHLGGFAFGAVATWPFRHLPVPAVKQRLEKRREEKLAEYDTLS